MPPAQGSLKSPGRETVARMILPEIAAAYGRSEDTVAFWRATRPWPQPTGTRGRWDEYDPGDVDAAVRAVLALPGEDAADPDELLDMKGIASDAGVAYATVRSWVTRKNRDGKSRWPAPDDGEFGVNRWKRSTARKAVASMRPNRRRGTRA